MRPKPSPFEKLAKELHTIMHEEQPYISSSSDDVLIESITPLGSFEIGNGSFLLKYKKARSIEDESEASSHAVGNKSCITNEAYSASVSFPIQGESKRTSYSAVGIENFTESAPHGHDKRKNSYLETLHFLQDRDSPLCFTDLEEVVNFEVLMKNITNEERQQLMEYLPSLDTDEFPESLREMFNSSQFKENLTNFQQLLQGGVFGSSISDINIEDYRGLKTLVLKSLSTSTWVGYYKKLKDRKYQQYTGGQEVATCLYNFSSSKSTPLKQAREMQCSYVAEHQDSRSTLCNTVEFIDNIGSGFSSRSFFDESSSSHDLLLNSPCDDYSKGIGLLAGDHESRSGFPKSSFSCRTPRYQ